MLVRLSIISFKKNNFIRFIEYLEDFITEIKDNKIKSIFRELLSEFKKFQNIKEKFITIYKGINKIPILCFNINNKIFKNKRK